MTIAAMIGTVNVVTERLGLQPLHTGFIVPAMIRQTWPRREITPSSAW
jgi:hypothetical protein